MDRRVQFRRAVLTSGMEQVETWADHGAAVWASRKDVRDSERMDMGQTIAVTVSRFTVRSSALTRGIGARDRFTCDGREWDILGIKEIGRRDRLEITASVRAD